MNRVKVLYIFVWIAVVRVEATPAGKAGEEEVKCGTYALDPTSSGYMFNRRQDWPIPSPQYYECTWNFYGTDGCKPVANCNTFTLGNSDYLDLSDGMGIGEKFSGTSSPKNVSSPSSILIASLRMAYVGLPRSINCTVTCTSPNAESKHVLPTKETDKVKCSCGKPGPVVKPSPDTQRIIGGHKAEIGFWRWQVELVNADYGSHACGGSLINDRFVLTAAHCLFDNGTVELPKVYEVDLNEYNYSDPSETTIVRRKIAAITLHPFYNDCSSDYDVAILELDEPVDLLASEEPILTTVCLPERNERSNYVGVKAVVIGWGNTTDPVVNGTDDGNPSEVLLQVEVPVITMEVCKKQHALLTEDEKECTKDRPIPITSRMICAGYSEGGKDACQGDSGGPLMKLEENKRYTQIGIVSFGVGCGREEEPGVYARVTDLNDWIRMTARSGKWCGD